MGKRLGILGMLVLLSAVLVFSGCGGSTGDKESRMEGNYELLLINMLDMNFPASSTDIKSMLKLEEGGKAVFGLEQAGQMEESEGTWNREEENQISVTIEDETMTGIWKDQSITFENWLESGMTLLYAEQDTEAMDLSRYLTEEEMAFNLETGLPEKMQQMNGEAEMEEEKEP